MRTPVFAGGTAVITGGAGGIGLALAHRFAREGMNIVLADVEEQALHAASSELCARGIDVLAKVVDVTSPTEMEALADAAYARFGAIRLLFNNAGVVPSGRTRPVWEYAFEDWRWAMDVNVMGVVNGIRAFVPRMIASGAWGHVVNTASMAGLVSGARSVVYSTTKHAVIRISEALYAALAEGGHEIGATVLCPGLVNTAIYRSERNRPRALTPKDGVAPERPDLINAASKGLPPEWVADFAYEAIVSGKFYAVTSDAYDQAIRERTDALLARRNPQFIDVFSVQDHPSDHEAFGPRDQ